MLLALNNWALVFNIAFYFHKWTEQDMIVEWFFLFFTLIDSTQT